MSVIITQEIITSTSFGNLGVIDEVSPQKYEVTYTANNIEAYSSDVATAFFNVFIGGKQTNKRFAFQFKPTGDGELLTQAEDALKTYLSPKSDNA